jgi:nucleoside-diphosphate-sugar epimerase
MRILAIGGAGFIGSCVVRTLLDQGHEVAVYHRGSSNLGLPEKLRHGVREILGDRSQLAASRAHFRDFAPDVAIDFILASESQAQTTVDALRGIAGRIVALSSGDVYRAAGVLHGAEPGPRQPVPLTEDSDLRAHGPLYRKELLEAMRQMAPWLASDYDKIPVERAILSAEIAGTVLRLPMVYGPGDWSHRLHAYLKRMDDGRSAILMQEGAAEWRAPRGYVENIAAAIALAATAAQAAGRIYNVAEPQSFSEAEWVRHIGRSVGWSGAVVTAPAQLTPAHLKLSYNLGQHLTMSSAKIREELGYREHVPPDVAIARAIEWERFNPPSHVDAGQFNYEAEDAALEQLRVREKIALLGA